MTMLLFWWLEPAHREGSIQHDDDSAWSTQLRDLPNQQLRVIPGPDGDGPSSPHCSLRTFGLYGYFRSHGSPHQDPVQEATWGRPHTHFLEVRGRQLVGNPHLTEQEELGVAAARRHGPAGRTAHWLGPYPGYFRLGGCPHQGSVQEATWGKPLPHSLEVKGCQLERNPKLAEQEKLGGATARWHEPAGRTAYWLGRNPTDRLGAQLWIWKQDIGLALVWTWVPRWLWCQVSRLENFQDT